MMDTRDKMQKVIEYLIKDGVLENFVYGLIDEYIHDEDFVETFVQVADQNLHPDKYWTGSVQTERGCKAPLFHLIGM